MGERIIAANGVELCTDSFGSPADPPILLVMGIGTSMLWWDERFCEMLARGGRFVVRYDHRDTGRSLSYEPGHPEYTGADLVADAAGVLDAYGVAPAHIVGMSAGGALAQLLALDFPDSVLSLVLVSTSPATPGDRNLPPAGKRLRRFFATVQVDWSDARSVADYRVEYWRALWGGRREFDESYIREIAQRDVERTREVAAAQNHSLLPDAPAARDSLSSITVPTLVIHGTDDPMFPLAHGIALADEIPDAELLPVEGAGHGVDPIDWDTAARAILDHTGIVAPKRSARPPRMT